MRIAELLDGAYHEAFESVSLEMASSNLYWLAVLSAIVTRYRMPDLEITKPIVIGNSVYLGNNVTLLPGVTIGDNVVVGACSVVSRDIPSNSVAVGVPARVIKTADEYYEIISA